MSEEKQSSSKQKGKGKKPKQKEEESDSSSSRSSDDDPTMEAMRKFFMKKLNLSSSDTSTTQEKVFEDLTFEGFCKHWKEKGFKNIVTMVGAGISTSAGIPDFRSPGTGLYHNLQKYNLPHPTAIFELDYFNDNPQPFFTLAKELYPGTFNPTPSHYFVRLLHEKGLLVRHYTQNIDTLEHIAGIPSEKLVEAHGTFFTNHCLECRKEFDMAWMKEEIFADRVPTCDKCNGIVKPDIVFFGESLPEKFYSLPDKDFKDCDLLIVMGTSLEVQPFASLVERASRDCVRLLINRTMVESERTYFGMFGFGSQLLCGKPNNTRDVAYLGDCDDGVFALAKALGWTQELRDLIQSEHERLAKKVSDEKVLAADKKQASDDDKRDEAPSGSKASKESSKNTPNGNTK